MHWNCLMKFMLNGSYGRWVSMNQASNLLQNLLPLFPVRVISRRISSIVREELGFWRAYTAERLASYVELCTDIEYLRTVHARIFGCGFGDNIFLGSKLLNCYAKFDGLAESRLVLKRIINRNLSLWNSAIIGYFRAEHFEEVLFLYRSLKLGGIGLDSSAIVFGLKSCDELERMDFGGAIHGDASKVGLNEDKFVGPSLIILYSKYGLMEDAQRAFEDIFDKDIVAFTAMITAYAQQSGLHAMQAFRIAGEMHREGLDANRVSLVSLLQAAGKLEAFQEGRSVHCFALRRGMDLSDEVLETSLVDMYVRCGATAHAVSFLRKMRRSVASWNALITGLFHCRKSYEALDLFHQMVHQEGLYPNSITIANVLSICTQLRFGYLATIIHGYILRRELPLDLVVTTALIELYSQCRKISNAKELFDQLTVKDTVLYNVIISGYANNGAVDDVVKMLDEMLKTGLKLNSITMLALLSVFADLADLRRGMSIHGFIVRHSLQSDLDVSNQILHMYAKCGRIDFARKIFDNISCKDLVSWTALMMAYVNQGHADETLALFQLMHEETGEKPDSVTLITLLQALSQLGLLEQILATHSYIYRLHFERESTITSALIMAYARCGRLDIAKTIFSSLQERKLNSWNTMIAAYGMHGHCREVLELFHQMQKEYQKPDGLTFSSVLSACSHAGLVKEGWQVFHSMNSRHCIAPQEEHYSCMVDLLARRGELEQAYELVKCSPMKDKTNALCALLSACRVHRNTELGEAIGMQLLELEPQNSSTYAMVSNIYAEAGKYIDAASLRSEARERGLRKMPGYSLVEAEMNVCVNMK